MATIANLARALRRRPHRNSAGIATPEKEAAHDAAPAKPGQEKLVFGTGVGDFGAKTQGWTGECVNPDFCADEKRCICCILEDPEVVEAVKWLAEDSARKDAAGIDPFDEWAESASREFPEFKNSHELTAEMMREGKDLFGDPSKHG